MITPAEFERRMAEISEWNKNDPEKSHIDADDLMCEVLDHLGYSAGVAIFKNMRLWYS